MAAAASWEQELLRLASKYEADADLVDVLEALSQEAKLLAATERLRRLMRLESAKAGGNDGLFELRPRTKDGAVQLVGEGERLSQRMRVRSHEDVRLLDGTTKISARVDLLPPSSQDEGEGTPGAASTGKKPQQEQQKQQQRPWPSGAAANAVQLHFEFTRRPGPKRGFSMPYPAVEAEEQEEKEDNPVDRRGSSRHTNGEGAAPTIIVEYSISASASAAEPPVEILHLVIYGLHPSGTPSPRGIRGPEEEEEEDEEEPRDLGLVELDDEALGAALEWCCGPTAEWTEPQFLHFLLFFPFWEEEFDVPWLVIDQVFGMEQNDESQASLDGPRPVPSPRSEKGQRRGKKKRRPKEQESEPPSPPEKRARKQK